MTEELKEIIEYKGYLISNYGYVYSTKTNKKLKPFISRNGYCYIDFSNGRNNKQRKALHRLVASYFHDNKENKPDVNHKDCNKVNNRVDNLEWCTESENMKYAFKLGRGRIPKLNLKGELHGSSKLNNEKVKLIKCLALLFKWKPQKISLCFSNLWGVKLSTIRAIIRGDRWKHI